MDLRPDDFRTFGGILERAGLTCLVCGGGYLVEVRQRPINWVTTIGTMLIFLPLLVYGEFTKGMTAPRVVDVIQIGWLMPAVLVWTGDLVTWLFQKLGFRSVA
ncbi:MAG: hypothetical protein JST51_11750 [Armatimonadetes bacterium]|nr:hypothetical protein [Armatimonadota bacterium]